MRIGIISDLHVDDAPPRSVENAVIAAAKDHGVEALVIAGDIASAWRRSLEAIDVFQEILGIPAYFVPGNHDLWNRERPEETAEFAMERLAAHPSCLVTRSVTLGGLTFIGETGWYDGTLAEGRFSAKEIAAMNYGGRTWQDSLFTRWSLPMEEKAQAFLASLERRLEGTDPARTVAVTHVVPHLDLTVQPPEGIWTYFNGLLGSSRYGELFARRGLRAAICGHVHYRRRFMDAGVEWICACLGATREWRSPNADLEAKAAMEVLDTGVLG